MELIAFEVAVIARKPSGELLIALMDGVSGVIAGKPAATHRCVGLLLCGADAARSLCDEVRSILKDLEGQ